MRTKTRFVEIATTVAGAAAARRLTRALLAPRLAACVQAMPIRSVYWWKGRLEKAAEIRLLAKTTAARQAAALAAIRAAHPYETPEIVVTPILGGHPPYLAWIERETTPSP